MPKAKELDKSTMTESHTKVAKRPIQHVDAADRYARELERTFRDFVDSVNRSKDSEMARAMIQR